METFTPQELKKQAESAYRAKRYGEAAELFAAAARGFTAAGDVLGAAEMSSSRSVCLLQAGDAPGALAAAEGVSRVFELAGDRKRQALALGNEAAALNAAGKTQAALERYQMSADLLREIGDHENRALVLKNISEIQLRTGHQLEALATMDAALNHRKKMSLPERLLKKLLKVPFNMLNRGG